MKLSRYCFLFEFLFAFLRSSFKSPPKIIWWVFWYFWQISYIWSTVSQNLVIFSLPPVAGKYTYTNSMYSSFFSLISIACILSLPSSRGFTTWSMFLLHSMATPLYSLWVSTSILADYICPHLSQQNLYFKLLLLIRFFWFWKSQCSCSMMKWFPSSSSFIACTLALTFLQLNATKCIACKLLFVIWISAGDSFWTKNAIYVLCFVAVRNFGRIDLSRFDL